VDGAAKEADAGIVELPNRSVSCFPAAASGEQAPIDVSHAASAWRG